MAEWVGAATAVTVLDQGFTGIWHTLTDPHTHLTHSSCCSRYWLLKLIAAVHFHCKPVFLFFHLFHLVLFFSKIWPFFWTIRELCLLKNEKEERSARTQLCIEHFLWTFGKLQSSHDFCRLHKDHFYSNALILVHHSCINIFSRISVTFPKDITNVIIHIDWTVLNLAEQRILFLLHLNVFGHYLMGPLSFSNTYLLFWTWSPCWTPTRPFTQTPPLLGTLQSATAWISNAYDWS